MGSLLKFGLIGLGVCLVLCAVAAVVFMAVFDPNDYKDRISRAVLKETGRALTFDGDIGVTFFPSPGVRLGGLSLSNADGFGAGPMVSVRSARVTVRLLPLLTGKVRFGELELDGPVLNLGRDAQGRANWDDLVGREPGKGGKGDRGRSFDLVDLAGVSVTGGELTWDDRGTDVRFALNGLEVTAGAVGKDGLFPVKLSARFDCGHPDIKTRIEADGTARVDFKPGRLVIEDMELSVDGTRIVGRVTVERSGEWPRITAQVDVGDLDLDRYLPSGHGAAGAGLSDATILPGRVLRRLDFGLDAKVARLKLGGALFSNVAVAASGVDGLVTVDPFFAEAYGGTIRLTGTVDARSGVPVTRTRTVVAHLDVAGLARDVTGKDEYAGVADYDSSLSARGQRVRDILGTLGGDFSFKLSDGVFPGVDLIGLARSTHSARDRQGTVEGETGSTRFGSISGTGTVLDGVVRNRDLEVKAPGLRADGHGAVSLVTRRIDYMVRAKLVPTSEGQGGKSSENLIGVMVPIHVTGTIDRPRYWVSIQEYVKALGGVVVDTVGTVLGGVKSVVRGVGSALDNSSGGDEESGKSGRKKFLGIF
ncbi:putative assembly protein [Pseudodesulfovibrio hydrargyri]|uniref:Putative assembly protein n=1 Tax=Pseudodesulfovibrio hydrargyri TaxID=2125990 RepID=A0A1J5NG22_9BACT|nr:AsmA family protein [Pseudodesulfovibrio hydrargyri]OIQ52167.1 putative assembly protein [Pseudodesulfovibrio hydrargyri]